MKELNFSNSDITTNDNKLIFKDRIVSDEDIKIDSTSIILEELECKKNITANYSLIIFDSLRGKDITIRNDLTCYGDIECENLNVQGDLKCYGNLNITNINIKGDTIFNTGFIHSGNMDRNLFIQSSLEVTKDLYVKGNVICNEGIIGEGTIHCEYVYSHEYLEIDVKGNDISNSNKVEDCSTINNYDKVLLKIQESNNMNEFLNSIEYKEAVKNIELILEEIDQRIPSIDNDYEEKELLDIFKKLSCIDRKYKFDGFVIKVIDKIQDTNKIEDLYEYLKLINYKNKLSDYMFGLDSCRYTFNNFLDKQKANIENMNIDSINTNENFAKALSLLEVNKDYFSKEEYISILGKLYGKIGVALKLVSRNLNIEL